MTLVHGLIPVTLVTHGVQTLANVVDLNIGERGSIALAPLEDCNLPEDALDQLRDGHAGRDGVGVDDDVGDDALARERHVLLAVRHPDRALLAVPRREFVTDLWYAYVANSDLREAVPLLRRADKDVVDDTALVRLHGRAAVPLGVPRGGIHHRVGGRRLTDQHVVSRHACAGSAKAVFVKLAVIAVLHPARALDRGALE